MTQSYILTLECADRPGILFRVTSAILEMSGNITDSRQFNDAETSFFFLRMTFVSSEPLARLRAGFAPVLEELAGLWRVDDAEARPRVLILVSKFDHCLADLLYRRRVGELPIEIVGIISNHPLASFNQPDLNEVPVHHLPVSSETKLAQEGRIKEIITESQADLVVLARYMQILSPDLCRFLAGRCINIHHSFLPSFKGAKPYHQAHARGVKIIGATAHYVTEDLDEGPIIHQDVEAITHADEAEDLVRKGRSIEQRVLAEAVRAHVLRRVFSNGIKTVVFRD